MFALPPMPYDFYKGLAVVLVSLVLFLIGRRIDARPADPLQPRLLPWRAIQVVSGVAAFLAFIFLINLFRINAPVQRW